MGAEMRIPARREPQLDRTLQEVELQLDRGMAL